MIDKKYRRLVRLTVSNQVHYVFALTRHSHGYKTSYMAKAYRTNRNNGPDQMTYEYNFDYQNFYYQLERLKWLYQIGLLEPYELTEYK